MRKFNALLLIIVCSLFFGCKKDDSASPAKVMSRNISAPSWSYSSPSYSADLDVPELTSSNLNSAAVMVYFSVNDGSTWYALPYEQYNGSLPNYIMGFSTRLETVRVYWIYNTPASQGYDPNEFYGTTLLFKVVVVSEAARMANPDVDLKDYEAVKERFKLAD